MKLGLVMSGTNFPVHIFTCMAKSPDVFALGAVLPGQTKRTKSDLDANSCGRQVGGTMHHLASSSSTEPLLYLAVFVSIVVTSKVLHALALATRWLSYPVRSHPPASVGIRSFHDGLHLR